MSKILILAIGGAAANMAETIIGKTTDERLKNARFVFAGTDRARIGQLAANGYETLALDPQAESFPADIIKGVDSLYILAGLGGDTGSHFAPLAVRAAISLGVSHIKALVCTPFLFEGIKRNEKAASVLEKLQNEPRVSVFRTDNNTLIDKYPEMNFMNAFDYSDLEVMKTIEADCQ